MEARATSGGPPGPSLAAARSRDLRLDPVATAARQTRAFVRAELDGVSREVLDTVLLVATELVTNAVLHAEGPIDVRLEVNDDSVLVRVFDCEIQEPRQRPLDVARTDGRGIALVSMVSEDWGTVLHEGGKTVWAVIAR